MTRNRSVCLLVLLAAAAAAPARAAPPDPARTTRVRTVRTTATEQGAWVPASVLAVERATISTRVAARVEAVRVQEGQRVARGQLLASLSDADLRGAASAARTALDAAASHERRIRKLLEQRAATPSELELAASGRAQAAAALAAARANLAYAQLRAPFSGTVQARRVEPGDLVGPGQPLLVLEGDALELQASLSESEAEGLGLGTKVRFEAGGASGRAIVTALTPGGDPVSHRRSVRARIEGPRTGLRSGAFARVEVPGGGPGAARAWVPRSALVERGDLTGVFVATRGHAELRWIAVGEPAGEGVLVRAGLRPGEAVVDVPGALRDGQPVEVVP
jgi:RND family efflux transporter MFP subunit